MIPIPTISTGNTSIELKMTNKNSDMTIMYEIEHLSVGIAT